MKQFIWIISAIVNFFNGSFGCGKEGRMAKYKSGLLTAAVMAVILSASLSARAEEPAPADSEDNFVPAEIFANANLFGEDARNLAYYYFFKMGSGYFGRAKGAIDESISTYVKSKKKQGEMHYELDPFTGVGKGVMDAPITVTTEEAKDGGTVLVPGEMDKLPKEWETYISGRGCSLGSPESSECEKVAKADIALAEKVVDMVGDEDDKILALGFLKGISEYYKENENTGRKVNYPKLSLMAQAAIYTLPSPYHRPFDIKGIPGHKEVKLPDITEVYGDSLTLVCLGMEEVTGTIAGETDAETLYLDLAPETTFHISAEDLEKCRLFQLPSTGPNKCEEGVEAFKNKVPYEGNEWLTECPEDLESLMGREVLTFPEECKDDDGKPVLAPKTGKITKVYPDSGMIEVTFSDGTDPKKFDCEELSKLMIAMRSGPTEGGKGKTIILPTNRASVKIQGWNVWGFGTDIEGMSSHGALAIVEVKPFAKKHFAFVTRLGIGGVYVGGLHPDAFEKADKHGDLLGMLGIGADGIFTDWFALGARVDFLVTLAGAGGVNGELLATFTPHPRVSLFAGPTIGFLRSKVPPGTDNFVTDCNFGAPCGDIPDKMETPFAGFAAGIGINFGLPRTKAEAKVRAKVKTEEE